MSLRGRWSSGGYVGTDMVAIDSVAAVVGALLGRELAREESGRVANEVEEGRAEVRVTAQGSRC